MKIGIGSDHAGFRYKEILKAGLAQRGHEVKDFGTASEAAVDYPVFVRPVALSVAAGECDRGIVLGGSGNGEAIVANRVRGIRCTIAWNVESARVARSHNDSNVLSLGQRFVLESELPAILDAWLDTPFDGGRHQRRIDLIDSVG
jgi:ribose 5-phosphate isomerase B